MQYNNHRGASNPWLFRKFLVPLTWFKTCSQGLSVEELPALGPESCRVSVIFSTTVTFNSCFNSCISMLLLFWAIKTQVYISWKTFVSWEPLIHQQCELKIKHIHTVYFQTQFHAAPATQHVPWTTDLCSISFTVEEKAAVLALSTDLNMYMMESSLSLIHEPHI